MTIIVNPYQFSKSFEHEIYPNLTSAGNVELLGGALNHYTMVVAK
jgi:hypothetical protein